MVPLPNIKLGVLGRDGKVVDCAQGESRGHASEAAPHVHREVGHLFCFERLDENDWLKNLSLTP